MICHQYRNDKAVSRIHSYVTIASQKQVLFRDMMLLKKMAWVMAMWFHSECFNEVCLDFVGIKIIKTKLKA